MLNKIYSYLQEYRGSLIFCSLVLSWGVISNWDRLLMKTFVDERATPENSFWQANEGVKVQGGRSIFPCAKITFWKTAGIHAEFFLEFQRIEKVIETKWLANRTAIFLHLDVRDLEPGPGGETKIIFDFDRGQLVVFSEARLWRTKLGLTKIHWATKEEFEQYYQFLDSEKQRLIDEVESHRKQ